nr:uncharacterized protein LOC127319584 [Lolium perenne]
MEFDGDTPIGGGSPVPLAVKKGDPPSSYRPASTPLARAWVVPVGTINLFVGLTGISDPDETRPSQVHDPFAPGQLLTATLPLTGEVQTEAEQALEDDADSAGAASTAESIATASVAGSIVAASLGDSIVPVSNPSDFEDDSVLPLFIPLFSSDSDSDSVGATRHQYPTAIFIAAGEGDQPPQDPFSTPLPPTATAAEIEAHRAALEEQRKRELVERQKFRLEQDSVRAVSHYRNERNRARMERIQAQGFPSARLNFDDPDGEVRVARPTNPDIPESSWVAAGGVAHGAPPPPLHLPEDDRLPKQRSTPTACASIRPQQTTSRRPKPPSPTSLKQGRVLSSFSTPRH